MTAPTVRRTEATLKEATILATTITDALTALDNGLAGWPTSTPGASPATTNPDQPPDNDEHTPSTIVERTALTPDIARQDLDALQAHIRVAHHHTRRAALLSQKWGFRGLDRTTVTARLTAIDEGIWCVHCSQFPGQKNIKETARDLCSYCSGFRAKRKMLPPRAIFTCRDSRGGIIYEHDVIRILAALKVEQARTKAAQRAAQKNV